MMSEQNTPKIDEKQNSFTDDKTPFSSDKTEVISKNQPVVRVRRVGTFTMGLAMISTGVIALVCLISNKLDLFFLLRFSPIILILLGLEVLLSHLLYKNDRLKYDFFSGFICFLLVCASAAAAMLPQLLTQYGPQREELRASIRNQIESTCYQSLAGNKNIQSLDVSVYLNGGSSAYQSASPQSLTARDDLHLQFVLAGDHADPQRFAQDARAVLDQLEPLPISPTHIGFRYESVLDSGPGSVKYSLDLFDRFSFAQDAEGLAKMIQVDGRNSFEQQSAELYDEIEEQRQALNQEHELLYQELERQRAELSQDRDQLYAELEAERAQLYAALEAERS